MEVEMQAIFIGTLIKLNKNKVLNILLLIKDTQDPKSMQ